MQNKSSHRPTVTFAITTILRSVNAISQDVTAFTSVDYITLIIFSNILSCGSLFARNCDLQCAEYVEMSAIFQTICLEFFPTGERAPQQLR